MKHFWSVILALCLMCSVLSLHAENNPFRHPPTTMKYATAPSPMVEQRITTDGLLANLWMEGPPDNQEDPGYTTYKEGYEFILNEKWAEARKKFAEVISKYPKSEYLDDAEYWSAYAMKHINRKKAAEEYDRFVKTYPSSSYYDDAVADLATLAMDEGLAPKAVMAGPNKTLMRPPDMPVPMPNVMALQHNLRRMQHNLRVFQGHMATPAITPMPPMVPRDEEKLDPQTRLKLEALYALGEKEDEKTYQTLKDIALDSRQPRPLREAAISTLSDFKKFDVLSVYLEIAKRDTSEEMQNSAIEYVGQLGGDKNKSVEMLTELFAAVPKHRTEQRGTILFAVADIGNDRAVDFLTKVARTDEDYDLRSDAVYYLGNIGGEKARTALYEILRGK